MTAYGTVIAVALGALSCGTQRAGAPIARVGTVAIDTMTADHWSSVMAGGRISSSSSGKRLQQRRRALEFLITAHWLIGAAEERGLRPSRKEIRAHVDEIRRAAFPGGSTEWRAFLGATGETDADVELEAMAELASVELRRVGLASATHLTKPAVAAYYVRHRADFVVPELREVWITNRKSATGAKRVIAEIASGHSAAALLQREVFVWPNRAGLHNPYKTLERAIHDAPPHVLEGPVAQRVDYFVFEIRRITPANRLTLAQVSTKITQRLARDAHRRALAAFVAAWRARWIAKTDCSPKYVVQQCAQYKGPRSPEDPLTLH